MTLQELSWAAGALSLVVATLAVIVNVTDRISRDRREELLKWQRSIVFSAIREGATSFGDIKMRYLQAAQQASDLNVPKKEIQDGALRLVLLSLLESGVISSTLDDRYVFNVVEPPEAISSRKQYEALFVRMMRMQTEVIPRVYEQIASHPGLYTVDSLHRELQDRFDFKDIDFNSVAMVVRMAVAQKLLVSSNEKLFPPLQPQQAARGPG